MLAGAAAQVFQTAWFVEALLAELAIVIIVRTRKPFWRSLPSGLLWRRTVAVSHFGIAIPYLPGADPFSFAPLPISVMAGLIAVTAAYLAARAKRYFFAQEGGRRAKRRRP